MTAEQIKERLHATPFTPFRVHVAALENVDAVHLLSVPLISKIETKAPTT